MTEAFTSHVCVGREGETEAIKQMFERDQQGNKIEHPECFIFVPEEARAVSSTDVRRHAAETEEQKIESLQELIDKKMITTDMSLYVLDNEATLYLE